MLSIREDTIQCVERKRSIMSDKELYIELKKKAEVLKNKIVSRNGERSVYINNLKSKGFNSLAEVDAYIEKAKKEQEDRAVVIKDKLQKYADVIKEAEIALGG